VGGSLWLQRERGAGWLGEHDAGTDYRLLMWKDGARLAIQHPLLGIGMDTVERRGNELNIAAYRKYPNLKSHFHSTFLQIAAECGWFALAAWIWLMAALLWSGWQRWRHHAEWAGRGLALGLLAAIAAFVAASAVHYTAGDAELMVVFWIFAGAVVIPPHAEQTIKSNHSAVAAG
jgi:O-antigen ligase